MTTYVRFHIIIHEGALRAEPTTHTRAFGRLEQAVIAANALDVQLLADLLTDLENSHFLVEAEHLLGRAPLDLDI